MKATYSSNYSFDVSSIFHCFFCRELAFFFPDFNVPTIAKTADKEKKKPAKAAKPKIQRTLALIRPDAMREKKGT